MLIYSEVLNWQWMTTIRTVFSRKRSLKKTTHQKAFESQITCQNVWQKTMKTNTPGSLKFTKLQLVEWTMDVYKVRNTKYNIPEKSLRFQKKLSNKNPILVELSIYTHLTLQRISHESPFVSCITVVLSQSRLSKQDKQTLHQISTTIMVDS